MSNILKNPSYQGFFIALLLSAFALWFYLSKIENENYIVIDNPINQVIKVQIDKEWFTIAPFQTLRVDISERHHSLKSYIEDSLVAQGRFNTKDEIRGLINPMLQDYAIYKRYYGIVKNRDSLIESYKTELDGHTYYGELYTTDSLFIKGFYLNVDQSYPKVLKNMDTLSGIPKIFRLENFKKFYRQQLE